jgi:hypothetical protein
MKAGFVMVSGCYVLCFQSETGTEKQYFAVLSASAQ